MWLQRKQSSHVSYHFIIFAQELGAGQELIILLEGDDGLGQLSEIQFQQRSYCVHICVTVERQDTGKKLGPSFILNRMETNSNHHEANSNFRFHTVGEKCQAVIV